MSGEPVHPRTLAAAAVGWADSAPVSDRYDDIYFSRHDGWAETRAVFLDGNGLPGRYRAAEVRARGSFTIGEIGFGTGLNFVAAREQFLREAPASLRLHFVSVEAHPFTRPAYRDIATRLAARWPALAEGFHALARRWPPRLTGWHRLLFDDARVQLSLWLGDASEGLADWQQQGRGAGVDAWCLDGFAPDRNPALWSAELCRRLAALSAAEASLATFSVARAVRDGLTAAGFDVKRAAGSGAKRQVLRGRLQTPASPPATPAGRVAVIGAGLAGACVAAALQQRGVAVQLFEAAGVAAGASGNPWAVLHPRLPLDEGLRGPLLASAYRHSLDWLDSAPLARHFSAQPVLQFAPPDRGDRMARLAQRYAALDDRVVLHRAAEDHLAFADAGHADLPGMVASLVAALPVQNAMVRRLQREADGWRVDGDAGPLAEGLDAVVVAAGPASAALLEQLALPMVRMRGQLDRLQGEAGRWPGIVTGRGHVVPLADGLVVGSSYEREAPATPPSREETAQNRARLAAWQALLDTGGDAAATLQDAAAFSGQRCHVPDRAPVLGRATEGLWVTSAHGSAGLVTCPLGASLIAAALTGEPPVLDAALIDLLDPRRFMATDRDEPIGLRTGNRGR